MSEWKKVKLEDCIEIKHGYAFKGEHIINKDNGKVLVTPGNFKIGGGFQESKCKFYNGEIPSDYILHPMDLIVTMTDLSKNIDTLGYSAYVPQDKNRIYLHNQRIGLVIIKNNICTKSFLYWLLRTHDYQRSIAGSSTGSTVHHTSPKKIYEYQFSCPNKDTQIKIADILNKYELLISNYQRQIKLLEEAAQRLYKEWFVDLHFPGYENTKIVDGVPEGWRRDAVSSLGDYINGFAFKPSDWQDHGLPIIKIKELNEGVTKDTPRNNGERVPTKYLIDSGDLLFSWSATLKVEIWSGGKGWLNQHLFKVVPNQNVDKEFLLQGLNNAIKEFENLTTGSTMKHIQRNKLDQVYIMVPTKNIFEEYSKVAHPLRYSILNISHQLRLLTEARDRLLPKLMSGEIEV